MVGEPVTQLCDIVEAEFEPMTDVVSVMLPVMVLVLADDPLLVGLIVAFWELLGTFFVIASTLVPVVHVGDIVETVTVQDDMIGYPAAAFSMCHVEQLVIVAAEAAAQDWI